MSDLPSPLLIPNHMGYIVMDATLAIDHFSADIARYVEVPELLAVGEDLRECFPELYGLEEIFANICAGIEDQFEVKAINRTLDGEQTVYLDLYFRAYSGTAGQGDRLVVFVEDVTDKMALEQTLVQANNETNLLMRALETAKQYANTIIESMAEVLIVTNLQGEILRLNPITEEILGYGQAELLGRSLFEILGTEESQLLHYEALDFSKNQSTSQRVEVNCCRKQGEEIVLAFSCSLLEQALNQVELVYVGRDVTRDRRDQERLAAQYLIARILSEANSVEQVTKDVLNVICKNLGFAVGELWTPIPRNEVNAIHLPAVQSQPRSSFYLQRVHLVTFNLNTQDFIEVTNRVLLSPGVGLAGRVWQQRSPQWIYELSEDQDFGLQSFACREGLHSAFAFPIMADGEMLGIMTFFCLQRQSDDPELLQVMDSVGQQLGQYIRRKQTEDELKLQQEQTEKLLLNILPEAIASQLKQSGKTIARQFDNVSVLFADLVGFTEFTTQFSPIEVVEVLNEVFSRFDFLTEKYRLEKIKTIGDAYMVVGGLPEPRRDHAEAIANMALEMLTMLQEFNRRTQNTLQLRIGINSGSVVAGVIGQKKFIYDLWGDTVNTASRMESQGLPDRIQCSQATYTLLKEEGYDWEERGEIPIKGKGTMHTYFLNGKLI